MSWLYYVLEANLYLVLFYGFYRLFLQNETFYNLNRYFLLLSTVISFALPILQLGFLKPSYTQFQGEWINTGEIPPPPMEPPSAASLNNPLADINWFYAFYLLIAFCFAVKLSFSIYKIIKIWLKAKKHTAGDITLIEVNGDSTAFSFFNLLFIHPDLANQPAVLKHEMVHIKQKHSFDVVFFELVQIICWFNPILHFIKKDIKLLHEYIADELTTNADVQKHEYALFLIQNSFGLRAQPITNQIFNQSILKRRINMLNKKRTASWARLRLLLALPLAGAMLCTSTMAFTKDYGYVDLLPEKSKIATPIQDNPKVVDIKKSSAPKVQNVKRDQIKFPPPIVKADKPRKSLKTPPPPVAPPPPKQDQVKFPPTFKPKLQTYFTPNFKSDKTTGTQVGLDRRYIVVNGNPVEDNSKFLGVTQTETVTYLNQAQAIKVYGEEKGKYGAVEITGANVRYNQQGDQIKFPPPVVKPDKPRRIIKTPPPPVEPPPPGYKTKKDQIKFPPPIVKPDKPSKTLKVPPPPVEPKRMKDKKSKPEVLEVEIKELPKAKEELQEVEIKNTSPSSKTKNKEKTNDAIQKQIEAQLKLVSSKTTKN